MRRRISIAFWLLLPSFPGRHRGGRRAAETGRALKARLPAPIAWTGAIGSSETAGSTSIWRARPNRVGYQHGWLLADEIADFLRVIKPFLQKSTKRDWSFYREASEKMLWPGSTRNISREIDGIVAGLRPGASRPTAGTWSP